MAFDSANTALESALALQDAFCESELAQEKDCALRIGLHLGEVVEAEDRDIYGDGVNVASRIEGQAEAGQVVAGRASTRSGAPRSGPYSLLFGQAGTKRRQPRPRREPRLLGA